MGGGASPHVERLEPGHSLSRRVELSLYNDASRLSVNVRVKKKKKGAGHFRFDFLQLIFSFFLAGNNRSLLREKPPISQRRPASGESHVPAGRIHTDVHSAFMLITMFRNSEPHVGKGVRWWWW